MGLDGLPVYLLCQLKKSIFFINIELKIDLTIKIKTIFIKFKMNYVLIINTRDNYFDNIFIILSNNSPIILSNFSLISTLLIET